MTETRQGRDSKHAGRLIVNADDWGRNVETTDRTLECVLHGTVSSVSGMVFMDDAERSAGLAREFCVDVGLHVNLTTRFSTAVGRARLIEHQERISGFLRSNSLAQAVFHPGLVRSFEYVVAAQIEEYCRLYGAQPDRLDGHHHMHLCANVLFGRLLPAGTAVRRNFTFFAGEKGFCNRTYRSILDQWLARRHRLTDFFFSLPPLNPHSRLQKIFSLASEFTVEVEAHPVNPEEYRFLMSPDMLRLTEGSKGQPQRVD